MHVFSVHLLNAIPLVCVFLLHVNSEQLLLLIYIVTQKIGQNSFNNEHSFYWTMVQFRNTITLKIKFL